MAVTPDTSLTQFPGVGEVRAKKLEKLGIYATREEFMTSSQATAFYLHSTMRVRSSMSAAPSR